MEETSKLDEDEKKECPLYNANFFSRTIFWWLNSLVFSGYKRPLTSEDLWTINSENSAEFLQLKFNKYLSLNKSFTKRFSSKHKYDRLQEEEEESQGELDPRENVNLKEMYSPFNVIWSFVRMSFLEIMVLCLLRLITCAMDLVNPIILNILLEYMSSNDSFWVGLQYGGSMFLATVIGFLANSQHNFQLNILALRLRSIFISTIYRKTLLLPSNSKENYSMGEIINFMFVDAENMVKGIQFISFLWSTPLQIGITTYFLWEKLGMATLGAIGVAVLSLIINSTLLVPTGKYLTIKLLEKKDKRTKQLSEIFNGIKLLKFNAWEKAFKDKANKFRNDEIKYLKYNVYCQSISSIFFMGIPTLMAIASFSMYVLINDENELDAKKIFVSLSLFQMIRTPMIMFPLVLLDVSMLLASLKRITNFLQSEQLKPNDVTHNLNDEDAISVENGAFSWSYDETPTVQGINLKIKKGSLLAVIGHVGAGKSSLLSALLGEMRTLSGKVNTKGRIAYVPQMAWIQNRSLKKNIIFTSKYDWNKYQAVIKGCALIKDLEILPGGDQTEIGEKGINLSGGQKQRISLARAVYSNSDIYIMDDPLSSVDIHVGKHLFESIIGPRGLLKGKTRILATNQLNILPKVDAIIVLEKGCIIETGTFEKLLEKQGKFFEFILQHYKINIDDKSNKCDENAYNQSIIASYEDSSTEKNMDDDNGSEILKATSSVFNAVKCLKKVRKESIKKVIGANCKQELKAKLISVERAETAGVKWSVYVTYVKAFGYFAFFMVLFLYLCYSFFNLASNIWLSKWCDNPTNTNEPFKYFQLAIYGILGSSEVFSLVLASFALGLASIRAAKVIFRDMLTNILKAPMAFFDTTPMGRLLNRFSKDIDALDTTILRCSRVVMVYSFQILCTFIIIFYEMPLFVVIFLPLGLSFYAIQKLYVSTSRQLQRVESISCSPIYSHFSETLSGTISIRAYKTSTQFIKRHCKYTDINFVTRLVRDAAQRWLAVRLELIGAITIFATVAFSVFRKEYMTPSVAGLCIVYALQIKGILTTLVQFLANLETVFVAVERCIEYIYTPQEEKQISKNNEPSSKWPENGEIVFEDYGVRYRETLPLVLKNVSCRIRSREKISVVGRTGAGKSSLTLALFRIIEPAMGKIIIDDIDVTTISLQKLREQLTIIPQDPVLLHGTLRTNLDPVCQYEDEKLWNVLELAHLKEFASLMPKGLEHEITEGGENLSIGQRQLICLARALLRKTKILILDEATASVDAETDMLMQDAIRTAFDDCTVITIAHRLTNVFHYDRIMVLSQGSIAEFDSPKALLENEQSVFYSMAKESGII